MKYFTYILRNARRNPVRSILTIASMAICLFLMMILLSFFAISDEANASTRIYNRIVTLNANGFAGMMPIARVKEIAQLDGVVAASPFSWYRRQVPGRRSCRLRSSASIPTRSSTILDELTIPADQLKAFQENKDGCVIGRKLAEDKKLKVGDSAPLEGRRLSGGPRPHGPGHLRRSEQPRPADVPVPLGLLRRGLEARRFGRSRRRRRRRPTRAIGQRGHDLHQVQERRRHGRLVQDDRRLYRNSDFPTRTQTEEAFGKMFEEMLGDLKG